MERAPVALPADPVSQPRPTQTPVGPPDGGALGDRDRRPVRHSPYRELSPLDEIHREVDLSGPQRREVGALVDEREALMTAAYSEAVVGRGDTEAGTEAVTAIYLEFDQRVRLALSVDQRARYDAGRRAGRIGSPMFVFRYGR